MNLISEKIFKDDTAPWLVMIYGFGGSKGMWKKQVEAFKDDYNIVLIELPGHGDSTDSLALNKDIALSEIGALIVDELHDVGIYSANFITVSLGTLVLAGIIETCPELVNSSIMSGAVLGMGFFSKLNFALGNIFRFFLPYMVLVKIMSLILMPRKTHSVSRKYLVNECRKLGRNEFMRWYSLALHEINKLRNNFSLLAHTKSMVIMGSEDYVFLKKAKKNVKKYADDISLKIIDNCGHVCSLHKWKEFNLITKSFLEESL